MNDFFKKQEVFTVIFLFILIAFCLLTGILTWVLSGFGIMPLKSFIEVKPFLVLTLCLSFGVLIYLFTLRWVMQLLTYMKNVEVQTTASKNSDLLNAIDIAIDRSKE